MEKDLYSRSKAQVFSQTDPNRYITYFFLSVALRYSAFLRMARKKF